MKILKVKTTKKNDASFSDVQTKLNKMYSLVQEADKLADVVLRTVPQFDKNPDALSIGGEIEQFVKDIEGVVTDLRRSLVKIESSAEKLG